MNKQAAYIIEDDVIEASFSNFRLKSFFDIFIRTLGKMCGYEQKYYKWKNKEWIY